MDLSFSPDEEAFRSRLRRWLDENPPDVPDTDSLDEEVEHLRRWQRRLHDAGWIALHWPREYGGRGATVVENFLFAEELARAKSPELIGRIGLNLVGPTLIAHGTEEQKRRLLPKIPPAEDLWCQLFSEPNAGSDLAAIRTRAVADGDSFVVTGQKVWTSYAQYARWGILLARTDADAPKHKGLSFFVVDMHAPGVEIRPLRQMTGSSEFNEVFFSETRVPRENLVGALGDGWRIANTTLTHERGTNARQMVIHRGLMDELLALARSSGGDAAPAAIEPTLRQELAQTWIEVEIQRFLNYRTLTRLLRGREPGPEGSLNKLFWSEMSQRMHDVAFRLLGPRSQLVRGSKHAVAGGRWQRSLLYYRAGTIFAGTSEIQRNIVAQRVLGLPRASEAAGLRPPKASGRGLVR
jgi:alkylation response protein AidB-like acyl-CoA dehydrogenase